MRLLQLGTDPSGTAYRCAAAAELPGWMLTPGEPAQADAARTKELQATMRALGFTGSRLRLTLPAECFQSDVARMPAMPEAELAESVGFEAQDRVGVERARTVIGHLRLGSAGGAPSDVLVLALPRELVESATRLVNSPSAAAVHVEHAALAALRGIARQRTAECADPAEAREFAMIHLEDHLATLVLVRDSAICFFRSIPGEWGAIAMTAHRTRMTRTGRTAIGLAGDADAIPVEPADQGGTAWRWCSLAEEALRCLRNVERANGGWWPSEIVLTGPAAGDPQAAATVENVCGCRASMAVPIRMVADAAPCVHGNGWIAAIGAACAELPAVRATAPAAARRTEHDVTRIVPHTQSGSVAIPLATTGARAARPGNAA
jgi:Tfp pilus assembly PilM family ATPase